MSQKKIGFSNTGSVQADRLIVNNGLTASTTYNFYGLTAISFNLPVVDGTAGQALKTDGAGNLSFGAVASSSTSGTSGLNGTSGTSAIGTSGTSGTDGAGTSGTSGISGTGTSGTSGANGVSGTSGTSGANGVSGTSGTSGANGVSGTSGTRGTSGTSGANGANGTSGTSGAAGVNGTSGTSGSSGQTGTSGTSGSVNASGTTNYLAKFTSSTNLGDSAVYETNSQLIIPDGTIGTPSLAFGTNTTLGIYKTTGLNEIKFSLSGADMAFIGQNTSRFRAGGFATPGIAFLLDTDTGIYNPSANRVGISTGGATSATFDSTGVTSNFIASSNGDVTTPAFRFGSGQGIYRTSGLNMYFAVDTTNGFGLVSTGGVIQSRFEDGVAATPSITFLNDTDTGLFRSAANTLDFAAGGERTFFVNNNNINVVATASENSLQLRTRNDGFVDYGLQNGTSGLIFNRYNSSGAFVDSALIIGKPEGDGGVLFRDGSVATPSISFQNEAGLGIYRFGTSDIRFVRSGVSMFQIAATTIRSFVQQRIADGTYVTPSIAFASDLDTGIYNPTANQFGIAAGGATAAVFGSTNSIVNRTYFEKAVNHYPVVNASVSGTYTVDMSASNVFNLTLTGNTTLDYSNSSEGSYMLLIKQDGTGGRSLSFTSGGKFIGATAVSIGTASNAKSIIQLVHIGTQSIVTYQTNLNNL